MRVEGNMKFVRRSQAHSVDRKYYEEFAADFVSTPKSSAGSPGCWLRPAAACCCRLLLPRRPPGVVRLCVERIGRVELAQQHISTPPQQSSSEEDHPPEDERTTFLHKLVGFRSHSIVPELSLRRLRLRTTIFGESFGNRFTCYQLQQNQHQS